jgi:c(7)-type cytochrome triheme protein
MAKTCRTSRTLSARLGRSTRHLLRLFFFLAAGMLAACSSQSSLLAVLFDIPPPGKAPADTAVVRSPRRAPYVDPSIQAMKDYLARQAELAKLGPATKWSDVLKSLPKDDDENIDWMAALEQKIINPGDVIDADTPMPITTEAEKVEAVDVTLATSGKPKLVVVFSHEAHAKWLNCANCHPAIFEKTTGTVKMTMDAMKHGQYCGACHDKVAITEPNTCKGCHKLKD